MDHSHFDCISCARYIAGCGSLPTSGPKQDAQKTRSPLTKRALRQTLVTCEENLERAKGFEPSTPTLARSCSTTELHPHPSVWRRHLAGNGQSYAKCGSRMQQPARGPKSARSPFIGDNGL